MQIQDQKIFLDFFQKTLAFFFIMWYNNHVVFF